VSLGKEGVASKRFYPDHALKIIVPHAAYQKVKIGFKNLQYNTFNVETW
jgi:hypothetical protein